MAKRWRLDYSWKPMPLMERTKDDSGIIGGWNDAADWRKQEHTTARECAMYVLLTKDHPR